MISRSPSPPPTRSLIELSCYAHVHMILKAKDRGATRPASGNKIWPLNPAYLSYKCPD